MQHAQKRACGAERAEVYPGVRSQPRGDVARKAQLRRSRGLQGAQQAQVGIALVGELLSRNLRGALQRAARAHRRAHEQRRRGGDHGRGIGRAPRRNARSASCEHSCQRCRRQQGRERDARAPSGAWRVSGARGGGQGWSFLRRGRAGRPRRSYARCMTSRKAESPASSPAGAAAALEVALLRPAGAPCALRERPAGV